jgi:hypothetical protein
LGEWRKRREEYGTTGGAFQMRESIKRRTAMRQCWIIDNEWLRLGRWLMVWATVALLSGCGGVGGQCSHVSITVLFPQGAQAPEFSWSPSCGVGSFEVDHRDTGGQKISDWVIIARADQTISPPVRYGVVPATADFVFDPNTLKNGIEYQVILLNIHAYGSDTVGTASFTLPGP